MFKVYKVTHRDNGHMYVGMTGRNINVRFATHVRTAFEAKLRKNRKRTSFHKALRRYGVNSFKIELLKIARTKELAFEFEKKTILDYMNLGCKMYNSRYGGMHGRHHSKKTRMLLSKIQKGKKRGPYNIINRKGKLRTKFVCSELTRHKMSSAKRGTKNPMHGRRKIYGKWVVPC